MAEAQANYWPGVAGEECRMGTNCGALCQLDKHVLTYFAFTSLFFTPGVCLQIVFCETSVVS